VFTNAETALQFGKLHCSLVQLSCSLLCYDAGNILIATRIANMMIARIVTLSK